MQIDIKNILVGLGASSIVMMSLFVAVVSFNNSGLGLPASLTGDIYKDTSEAPSGDDPICKFQNYAFDKSFVIPTHSPIKQGSSITLDSKGNIYSLFVGNNNVEKFNKDDGSNYRQFTKDGEYEEQSTFLPGIFVDEAKEVVYVPGFRDLFRLYRYDLNGNALVPAYWTNPSGFASVDGYGGDIFVLPSAKTGGKYILKKYDYAGNIIKQVNLPYDVSVYPDMSVSVDGSVYIPMNLVAGVQYKDSRGNKYYKYKYLSAILHYDNDLNPLPDFFRYETPERDVNDFTNEEKQPFFSRIAIDGKGNLTLLMQNINDGGKQNLFRQYDKNGNLLKEWSIFGLNFYDIDIDVDGIVFANTKDSIYKYSLKCAGKLIIKKIEEPDSGKDFRFDLIDPQNYISGTINAFRLKNNESKEFLLVEDIYNIKEENLDKQGYKTSISCISDGILDFNPFVSKHFIPSGNNDELSPIETSSEVQVAVKKDITTICTFTNTKIKEGLLPDNNNTPVFREGGQE